MTTLFWVLSLTAAYAVLCALVLALVGNRLGGGRGTEVSIAQTEIAPVGNRLGAGHDGSEQP